MGTFVAKEIVQEQLKDHIEFLEEKRQSSLGEPLGTLFLFDSERVLDSLNSQEIGHVAGAQPVPSSAYFDRMTLVEETSDNLLHRSELLSQGTAELLKLLPETLANDTRKRFRDVGPPPYDSAYIRVDAKLQELENRLSALKLPDSNAQFTESQKKKLSSLREAYAYQFGQADDEHFKAQENREQVLESLVTFRETLKERLRISAMIGYCFYTIGWFVNLVGGFFGLKPVEGE